MDYERIASDALLETCADRREDFLRDAAGAGARGDRARFGPTDAFRIPARAARRAPRRCRLAALMAEHGVEVKQAADGDVWIPLAPAVRPLRARRCSSDAATIPR